MSFPSIYFDGYYRVLSHQLSPVDTNIPYFASALFAAPQELKEIDMSWQSHRILNQKNTSSCVAHATTTGMEILYKQRQNIAQDFNPFFMYALINNGSDNGAFISDAMDAAMKNGICEKNAMESDHVVYKKQLSNSAYENAARFKLEKAYRCTTFDQVCQAINLGFVVNIGILVGNNFTRVDSEGIAPLPNGGGGGHSMLACGLKKHSKYGWLVKLQNSWGENFGLKGYCYVRKEHFDYYSRLDCFAFQGVIEDPKDPITQDNVPVVKS